MKKIAILIENMFNAEELLYPYHRLKEEYEVHLIGTEKNKEYHSEHGLLKKSTHSSSEVLAKDYVGLIIPGGYSPDKMRACEATKKLVRNFDQNNLPIGAICHGPWMLCSCVDLSGVQVTSVVNIKDDLINAGGKWKDQAVVVDKNYITSRTPKDLQSFIKAFLEALQ
ncbi:MAG: type 1 glutamine amidotransferase domain-containing protein [Tissierellia bacterium]|nr:type 1 glutamine amidotransferase domain-containing protein [Tissierellia bacterium]